MVERYHERTGHYPERVLADKIYRNRENISYCTTRNIRLSGPALGRPKKGEIRDKQQNYRDEADRIEVERDFSLAKRKCGLGLIVTRLEETTCHCLGMSILLLNLRKLERLLRAFLHYFFAVRKLVFIQ
jgi:IS5 family transposase